MLRGQTSNLKQPEAPQSGMWSRSRRLGLETVSRRTNVSSRTKSSTYRSRINLGPMRLKLRLGLGAIYVSVSAQ